MTVPLSHSANQEGMVDVFYQHTICHSYLALCDMLSVIENLYSAKEKNRKGPSNVNIVLLRFISTMYTLIEPKGCFTLQTTQIHLQLVTQNNKRNTNTAQFIFK
jgi:hypothetical protein